jgi:hypothetical protein
MRRDGHIVTRLPTHFGPPPSFDFSDDGSRLVTKGRDGEFVVSLPDLSQPLLIPVAGERAQMAKFAARGKELITFSMVDGQPPLNVQRVRWWSLDGTPKVVSQITIEHVGIELITEDRLIGVGFDDNKQVRVFDHGGKLVSSFAADGMVVINTLSRDGTTVATGSEAKTIRIWRVDRPNDALVLRSPGTPRSLEFTRDGRHVVGVAANALYAWRTDVNADPIRLPVPCNATAASLAETNERVAVTCEGAEIVVLPLPPLHTSTMTEALWSATSHCIPADERRRMLGESKSDANARVADCKRRAVR